jgi:hypothetical protein
VDRAWVRSAAFSCAFACGALVVGPGMVGTAVAHAGLFGIGGIDFFGNDDNKSRQHHPRPGEDTGGQASRTMAGAAAEAAPPEAKIGSEPVSAGGVSAPQSLAAASAPEAMTTAGAPESLSRVGVPESLTRGAGGGGAAPRSIGMGRASNLPPVPTAPATRSVVIRGTQGGAGTLTPSFVPMAPVTVPLAAPPPAPRVPDGRPAPAAPPSPSPQSPFANIPGAPSISGVAPLPDSFRVGYHEYLRTASTSDLFVAALPGVAGIAGFTLVGAYAGYRQARGLQRALQAPVPTSVTL